MKKRSLAIALTLAMAASLAACGSNDGSATSNNDKSTSSSKDTSEEKKDDEKKSGGVSLNVTTTFAGNDTNVKLYQDAIADWQDESGNTINDSSATSDETFKARVAADFEVGSEPDVLFYFNGMDSNSFVEAGKVMSIDDIRKEYPEYASNMNDDLLGASPVDGKNYSVPVNGYWEGMFVNKSVLEAAGVEVPDANTTWDEFMDICQKIKDAGYTPVAASLAQIPHYWFEFTIYNQLTPTTHNVLPKSVDDDHGKAWVAGIEDIKAMYEKGYFPDNTLSGTDDETFQAFIDGKAAFLVDGSWKLGGIEEATDDIENFTVTYVPGKGERKATDIIGGLSSGYYITKKAWDDPEKRDAAVKFVEYMTTNDMVSKFALTSATALKEGSNVDENSLSSLGKDGLAMVKGITGITAAVQDQVPTECRVPVFDGMPNLVTGKTPIPDAVSEVLTMIENYTPSEAE